MSDERPTGSTPPDPPNLIEMAMHAGQIRPPGHDEVDQLRFHVLDFIKAQGESGHALTMAKTKCEELIFWLRAHRNARR